MFQHMIKLLKTFPAHNFRAKWQHQQFSNLIENLPINHCIAIHDYSENYQCSEKIEIQSSYFQKPEVSLHVTLVYRHAVLDIDGIESTEENPEIISEQFFVVSPDEQHDRYFTLRVREELANHLKSISCKVDVMHEFCDGCAAQYKSRNCYGDLCTSVRDFGYKTIIRDFYETSHAKGPQDAAGGFIKRQADLAILRGRAVIQNAKDFYNFANSSLQETKSNKCQRRIFKYCSQINRASDRCYKPIPGIRSTHKVIVHNDEDATLHTRGLSCYDCERCITGHTEMCNHSDIIGMEQIVKSKTDKNSNDTDDNSVTEESLRVSDMINKGTVFAVLCQYDPDYDYYLVRAESSSQTLENDETDSWGTTWSAGTSVIKGKYFKKSPKLPLTNTLLKNYPAIVIALSVIYILELSSTPKATLLLPEHEHLKNLEILEEYET